MQFTVVALLSLVAVAFATPIAMPARLDDLVARQSTQTQPNGEAAAMSNQAGDVVSFNTADVYKAASNGDVA